MSISQQLTYLLLAAINGQDADLSAYTKEDIDASLSAIVAQGFARGVGQKRIGDPDRHYTIRGLSLTPEGERRLDALEQRFG